ncbi:MAG: protein kinase [Candidatus Hodarchaeota archaeon]
MKCPKCKSDNPDTQQFCGKCGTKLVPAKDIPASSTKSLVTPGVELTTGSVFAGRYQIVEELGEGGMGKVYKVIDKQLNEEVALKLVKPEIASDKKTIKRFRNELKLSRKISHRNVGRMYELMEDKGSLFITMEYVPGQDLKGLIRQTGRLAIGTTISIAKQVCEGLAEAHRLGVIHRDLKSHNIMIDKRGNARIMDFGIARSLSGKSITRAGAMIGTPEYMSPEQTEAEELDQRSDIYSLGVILYEMVTGRLPFEGDTPLSVAMKHKGEIPKDPKKLNPQIPGDLSRLILKCLEKDRENRYQDAEELRLELTNIEMSIPTIERVVPRKKTLTSKEITVSFNLKKCFIIALVAVALVIAVVITRQFLPKKESISLPLEIPSIAVLPFEDFSPTKDQEYFCEGLKESIIHALKQVRNLRVPATTSLFEGKQRDYREIGQKLKVKTVLDGSVQKVEDKVRIIAKLIDIADESIIWTDQFDPEQEDIFSILDKISMTIVNELKVNLLGGEKTKIVKRYTEDPEAFKLYSLGRFFWNKRTEEGVRKGIAYFQQATEKDPGYAFAYSGLADSYFILQAYGYLAPKEVLPKAKAAVMKALELDDRLAEAHANLGIILSSCDWDWMAARKELQRAIELNPSNAQVHHTYAHYLANMGQIDEAITEMKRAQALDPLSLTMNRCVGVVFCHARQYDQAIEQLLGVLDMDPTYFPAHLWLGHAYVQKGMYEQGIAELQEAITLSGGQIGAKESLGYAYGVAGRRDEALKVLQELKELSKQRYVSPSIIAKIYVGLGEKDQAFTWLEKAYEERHPSMIGILSGMVTEFDSLRSDTRFEDLVRRMGFPE